MKRKSRQILRTLLQVLEKIVKLLLPITAILVLVIRVAQPSLLNLNMERMLDLILLIVAGLAISEALSRYLTLEEIKQKLNAFHNYDIPNAKLIEMAHRHGIVALSPRFHKEWLDTIATEIHHCKTTLDICGVALPSLLSEERLKDAVLSHADKYDVRILLLDPTCPEADRRFNIEKPLRKTISDIADTIDLLKEQMTKNKRFQVHLYTLPPMLALYITEHHLFVEPYHFGKPAGISGCIGGYVPLLKIKNNPETVQTNSYAFFKEHFQYLWGESRVNSIRLDIKTMSFDPLSHITMRNSTGYDINVDGWTMSAQEVPTVYRFRSNYIWPDGQDLRINFQTPSAQPNEESWPLQMLRSTVLLTIKNARDTTVTEWTPQS